MSYIITTTLESELTLNQNLEYLVKEWDNKTLNKFLDRVDEIVEEIKQNPFSFPLYNSESNIRKAVINKRMVLFYRVVDDVTIEILTFWNTHRNPEDFKF